jgi:hypothetical protein
VFIERSIPVYRNKMVVLTLAYVSASVLFTMPGYLLSMNDPMQPPEYSASSSVVEELMDSELNLQMILISPSRKFAVLNNKTVTEGGMVSGAKIISIEKEHIVVKRKGKVFDLRLNSVKNRGGVVR